ncbi:type IV toxin-antitoxin system AbiEi family antitoxin domain-containing protein [Nocardioides sp.]|uniref:type IV toxin-antitoxin system AbiEi family antitoxin domain-containing protein n=1 Tax=Nocardioides sp. TaxID=35761 RepID=UPI0027325986|nr:type IV toxin-antitoxin system AbiEi family antitoxin domain-containing protein [Nocardioides sp.]MDP3893674.1 type IV toxin-antitoxin system AbiEi family antitoxin domain-containing protein [Nocardioides sp.]
MRPELAARAARQGGVVTRRQAIAGGYSEAEIRRLTRQSGPWVVVRRGVYAERELWESLDPYDGQWRLRDRAAHLTTTVPHVMSHDSAARPWGLAFLRPPRPLVHVSCAGVGGTRTEHGVKHHIARHPPGAVAEIDGLRVAGLARTVLDLAREHGFATGVTAADAALRLGVERGELLAQLRPMRCWPRITQARAAVEFADPGADLPGESLARVLVVGLGIGSPTTQFPVRLVDRVAWCDLRVGCHLFEFDGRIKYSRRDQGGVAETSPDQVAWDERRREVAACAQGLGMSRIIWSDLWGPARKRAEERLRAEYAHTLAVHGPTLPEHLARFARQMEGERLRRMRRTVRPPAA